MLLKDRNGIVFGVANKRSIGYACARAASQAGARLILTYQGERLAKGVSELAASLPQEAVALPCDVGSEEAIDEAFGPIHERMPEVDFAVHSIAYAEKEDLEGGFLNTSREGYGLAQEIGAYSLIALARRLAPMMGEGGSLVAMTYIGGGQMVPRYNVMGPVKAALESSVRYLAGDLGPQGIRVNAISAGPIRTLASSGISGFGQMLEIAQQRSPMRRNTEPAEVADATVFLASSLSRGVTGSILYVDNGFHVTAL